jgi:hypothetical protein
MPLKNKLYQAFYYHRYDASKRRGVSFELTFDEWLKIWIDSGHIHDRGNRKGKYVMARFGDTGPYSKNNVKIITCSENISEAQIGRPKSQITRKKISKKMTKPKSSEHKKKLVKMHKARRFLTDDQVEEIKRLYIPYNKKFCLRALSIKYNVRTNVIWAALQRDCDTI